MNLIEKMCNIIHIFSFFDKQEELVELRKEK
nr:MAG TPA: hypothetical protein [Bacteriophage sp.]